MNSKHTGGGLKPLSKDERDLKFGAIFALPDLKEIPDEFEIKIPINIKDQGGTDFCTAFAGTAVSEDQENIELDPLYQFFKTKQIEGNQDWGADLRNACKSFTKFGSIEKKDSPFTIDTPRETILNPQNWMPSFDKKANNHKKESYAFISGQYDFFDNIRATLWFNIKQQKSVLTGVMWCPEWTTAEGGVIDFQGTPSFGHALKIFGTVIRKGQIMLKGQLSNGQEIGENGIFYFSRTIINNNFNFGGVVFTDLPIETARFYQENELKIKVQKDNWAIELFNVFYGIFKEIFKRQKI